MEEFIECMQRFDIIPPDGHKELMHFKELLRPDQGELPTENPRKRRDAYWEQPPAKVQKDAFGGKGAWGKGKDSEFWGPGPMAVPGAKGGRDVPAVALVGAGGFPAAAPIP